MPAQAEVTHVYDAPRELVFQAFTDAEHLRNWWGPKGWSFRVAAAEFRPDGILHYCQIPPEGGAMWVKFVYGEVSPPEKIVYVSFFSDEEGNVARAPFDPNWPLETLNTVTFVEDNGKTTITLHAVPLSPTEAERNAFESSRAMVREGFGGTLAQLAEYLRAV